MCSKQAIETEGYIRTHEGDIGKIIDLDIDVGICTDIRQKPFTIDEIKEYSKDVIDLIEVRRLCKWCRSSRNIFSKRFMGYNRNKNK